MADQGAGLAQLADPLRPARQPEESLAANDTRPGTIEEIVQLRGIERFARLIDEARDAVLFRLRDVRSGSVKLLVP